jgi:ketosteroid isomerase-like protein
MSCRIPGLIALIAGAIWLFVVLPLMYLPSERLRELPGKAPVLTALAASCAAMIALAALLVARDQLSVNRQNQRETTAKTTFRDFLKLCVDNPELAYGEPTSYKQKKYEWFVAHFVWAAEEILEFAPNEWKSNLRLHVGYHKDYLQSDERFRREDWPTYSQKLRAFVDDTIKELPPRNQVLKKEIEGIGTAYADSFNSQDAAGIAALYASGGVHINPAGPRTDIGKFYQTLFEAGFFHEEVTLDQVWPVGDVATIAVGKYRVAKKDQSGTSLFEQDGHWTATYVREDGKWKIRMQTAIPIPISTNQASPSSAAPKSAGPN